MSTTFLRIEQCLLPAPEIIRWNHGDPQITEYTTVEKVVYYIKNLGSSG